MPIVKGGGKLENENQTAFQSSPKKFGEDEEVEKTKKKKRRKQRKKKPKKEFGATQLDLDFKEVNETSEKSLSKHNKHKKLMRNRMLKELKDKEDNQVINDVDTNSYSSSMFNNYFDNATVSTEADEIYHYQDSNNHSEQKKEKIFGSENESYNAKHSIYENEAQLDLTGAFFNVNEKKMKGSLDNQVKTTFTPENINKVHFETETVSRLKPEKAETNLHSDISIKNNRKFIRQHNLSKFNLEENSYIADTAEHLQMKDVISTAERNLAFLNNENIEVNFEKNTSKMFADKFENAKEINKFSSDTVGNGMAEHLQPTRIVVSEELKKSSIRKGKKLRQRQRQANKVALVETKTSMANELESSDKDITTSLSQSTTTTSTVGSQFGFENAEEINKFSSDTVGNGIAEHLQPTRIVVSEELKKSSIQKGKKLRQRQRRANKVALGETKASMANELESSDKDITTSLSQSTSTTIPVGSQFGFENVEETNKFSSTGIAENLVHYPQKDKFKGSRKQRRKNKKLQTTPKISSSKRKTNAEKKKLRELQRTLPFEKKAEMSSVLLQTENKGKSFKESLKASREDNQSSFEKKAHPNKNLKDSLIALQAKGRNVTRNINSMKDSLLPDDEEETNSGQTAKEVINKSLLPVKSSFTVALKNASKKNEAKNSNFYTKKSSFSSFSSQEDKISEAEKFRRYRKKTARNKTSFDFSLNSIMTNVSDGIKKAAVAIRETIKTFTPVVEKNKVGIIGCIIAIIIFSLVTSCSTIMNEINLGLIASSYMADDEDISKATAYYTKLEAELQSKIIKDIQKAERNNSYDEVRYNIANFQHSPEDLVAFLSAEFPGWSFDIDLLDWGTSLITGTQYNTVKKYEQKLFNEQYEYKEETITETHYTNSNDPTSAVRWKVKVFTLTNKGFNNVINSKMDDDVKEYYDMLKDFRGNRVWFDTPVKYKWTSTVANLFGYMVKGTNRLVNLGSASSNDFSSDSAKNGETITLPSGLGRNFTYMGWQLITSVSSNQYKLKHTAGEKYDSEGFAVINGRYVVAVTLTFGNVGDYIDVYQSDGTVIKCIIGEIKNQNDPGCNQWGHQNGACVLEFVVNYDTWYTNGVGTHINPGTGNCHPEWGRKTITKIANVGSFSKGDVPVDSNGSSGGSVGTISNISVMSTDVIEHKGIDIAGLNTSEVLAIFDGTVTQVSEHSIDIVDTEHNYKATYSSLNNINIHNHQTISKGDKLGEMADTEGIGIAHLYLEIKDIKNNVQLNPYLYIDIGTEEPPALSITGGSGAVGQLVAGSSELGNKIAELALTRVGYMYYWGGGHTMAEISNPNTTRLDCSGLVNWAYYQAGASIGVNNTKSLATLGKEIPLSEAQPGDIILYSSNGSASGIHHVTICIGGGNYVEAPYDNHPICTGRIYTQGIYSVRRLINY